jgi:hypothetical protein
MKLGAIAVITAIVLVACSGSGSSPQPGTAAPTTGAPASATPDARAGDVARAFIEAYGAFDVEQAIAYLADEADLSEFAGTREGLRLQNAWFDAMGYRQMLGPCEVLATSASGTTVRCSYDFHSLRSEEIGLGPFGGSYFEITVSDGAVVRASNQLNYADEFSPQVWEPFAKWVSKSYPADAEVMYTDGSLTDGRLTEESFRLWKKHSLEYVKAVAQG